MTYEYTPFERNSRGFSVKNCYNRFQHQGCREKYRGCRRLKYNDLLAVDVIHELPADVLIVEFS
jgi:hypothetical protein